MINKPVKFIWGKDDNLTSIHHKLLNLVNKQVVYINYENLPLTIFSVSDIKKTFVTRVGLRCLPPPSDKKKYKYYDKDKSNMPVWAFRVVYGRINGDFLLTEEYIPSIPRTKKGYNYDVEQCTCVVHPNHKFIHYEIENKGGWE